MNRLDPADAAEVALFADSLSITSEELLAIIEKVGPMRPAIRFFAMRSVTETKRGRAGGPRARTIAPSTAVVVQPHTLFAAQPQQDAHSPSA